MERFCPQALGAVEALTLERCNGLVVLLAGFVLAHACSPGGLTYQGDRPPIRMLALGIGAWIQSTVGILIAHVPSKKNFDPWHKSSGSRETK